MKDAMNLPIEIFGYVPTDPRVTSQRKTRICPFTGSMCTKQLYRTNEPPSGSCSVSHSGKNIIICPNRFLENRNRIVIDAAKTILKTNNLMLVPEVKLPGSFGRVDWVAVSIKDDRIVDFVPIEMHANQTTSTGGLTDAIREHEKNGRFLKDSYKFGLNTYHQIKTFFMQCLIKSQLFEKWNRRFIWIIEDTVYDNWIKRFLLSLNGVKMNDNIFFFSYGLEFNKKRNKFKLKQKKLVSTNRRVLLNAYTKPASGLPDEKEFMLTLRKKLNTEIARQLDKSR